jgi:Ca-activated chloride channel family protein
MRLETWSAAQPRRFHRAGRWRGAGYRRVRASDREPLSVALLIDTSASTGKDIRYEPASITKFLNALVQEGNPDDTVSLYAFNWQVTLLNSFTRRISRIEDNLKVLHPEGGTSLYDAIYLSSQPLHDRYGRP